MHSLCGDRLEHKESPNVADIMVLYLQVYHFTILLYNNEMEILWNYIVILQSFLWMETLF